MLGLCLFTHHYKMLNSIKPQYIINRYPSHHSCEFKHFLRSCIQIKVKFINWHFLVEVLIFWPHFMFRYAEKCFLFSIITFHVPAWKGIWRPLSIENDLDGCAYFPSKCNTIASKNLLSYIQECTKLLWILQRTSLTFCTLHVYEQ